MIISSTEKSIEEHGDKVSEEEKTAIKEAVEGLKAVKDGEDKEAIDTAMKTLEEKAHKLAEEIYKEAQAKAQAEQGGAQGGTENNADEDVAEAEVVD